MRCNPAKIIPGGPLKEVVRFKNGDTQDIIKVILENDAQADKYINADAAQCLVGSSSYDTLRNVYRFVKGNIRYRADKRGLEVVKGPRALFQIGSGDCKSLSIATVALLRALGYRNIRYRFTAYAPGDFTHVYVVVRSGGRDVILDTVYDYFDAEDPRYIKKKDMPAAKTGIAGIGGIGKDNTTSMAFLIGLIIFAIAAKKR